MYLVKPHPVNELGHKEQDFFSPQQFADRLGIKLPTIYVWISQRKIEYSKIGRLVRIPSSELQRLTQADRRPRLEALIQKEESDRLVEEDPATQYPEVDGDSSDTILGRRSRWDS